MKSAKVHRFLSLFALTALTALAISAGAKVAHAHTLLVSPPPLTQDDSAKVGPCGCEFGGDPACPANFTTTTLTAGATVTIKWKETVNHTGNFRLAFSSNPPDQSTGADFDADVLYDKADGNSVAGATLSTTITVPKTPCDPCTIQLRQFMAGAANPYYYSCASVRIVEPPSSSSSSSGDASGGGDPTGGGGGAGQGGDPNLGEGGSTGPGEATPATPIATGSCAAGGSSPGAWAVFAAASIALVTRARRKGRPRPSA